MSSEIINSNSASFVMNTLVKDSSKVQDLTYATKKSYPNLSKSYVDIEPYLSFTGAPDNNTDTFDIPQSNLVYNCRLKFTFATTLAAADITRPIAYDLVRQVQFLMNGQPILTYTGEALLALMKDQPPSVQEFCQRYAFPLVQATELPAAAGAGTFVSYLPLMASWLNNSRFSLNASKLNKIQIAVTYKSIGENGLVTAISTLSSKLEIIKYMTDDATMQKMVLADYSKPTIFQAWNTETERYNLTDDSSAVYMSTSKRPISKTHIFIRKANTTGTSPVSGLPQVPISTVNVEVGGQTYMNVFKRSMINFEKAMMGHTNHKLLNTAGDLSIVPETDEFLVIDWSLLGTRDQNSGLASFANLSNPTFSLTFPTITPVAGDSIGSYWVYFINEYENILELNPDAKIISVRSAN